MPLTLSHPALVLPLRRLGLPMTSLVIGSMVLDIPLYLGSRRGYEIAHSPIGIPTVDVIGTLLVLWIWFTVLRDPLADLAPGPIRSRLAPRARLTRRQWWLAPVGGLIGATLHVTWDSFTHDHTWGYRHVAWLRADHLGVAGLRWAQYASAVGGLVVIAAYAFAHLRRQPVVREPRPDRLLPLLTLPAVIVAGAVAALAAALPKASVGLHSMAFHGAVGAVVTLALGILLVCTAWQVRRFRREESVGEA
ncbi:DUF4184 family protein [Aeromicrobium sp. NPDC092404]|uniref:DUF4184 family protein n=1 Tax=Aeromicrobium sp. NPDC092404 TaxID=3154976 RepID=UPI00343DE1DA